MDKVQMQTYKEAYTFDYPPAIEMAEAQEKVFWTAAHIEVDKDIMDMKVYMSKPEVHGVITTLKLFTLYELVAGNEYWGGRFKRMFPRHDLRQMASTFAFTELGVHAPFYNKINKALRLDNDEFYTDYVNDPILKARMECVEGYVNNPDDLVSIGAFSMVEGAVLYSAFAFLKHFQTGGKNKLLNVVRGIGYSVRDENLHCEGGAWAFRQLLKEKQEAGHNINVMALESKLQDVAIEMYNHEVHIVDMLFSEGDIEGITAESLKVFVKSRLNICLTNLGMEAYFEVEDNPIADWFYQNINMVKLSDFFTGIDNSYNQDWNEEKFIWQKN